MICIVPLAGPDFERQDGTVKADYPVDGVPLLRRALESRPWWKCGALAPGDLIFVLKDSARSRRFAEAGLADGFGASRCVFLGDTTQGAALSVLGGLALARDFETPLIVDLCDILFEAAPWDDAVFDRDPTLGALAATFGANDPKYSYLTCDADGRMIAAREKIVISDRASAGVYLFRSAGIYLTAMAHALHHRDALAHNGLLYVCPLLNGVVAQGYAVRCIEARQVRDIRLPS